MLQKINPKIVNIVIVGAVALILSVIGISYYISRSSKQGKVLSNVDFVTIQDCFNNPEYDNINLCFDEFIEKYVGDKSVQTVLADMDQARTESVEIENTCHPIAHAIGRYSYKKYQNVGDAFQACDFTCHSGCYHGVMERMFFTDEELEEGTQHLTLATLEDRLPGICAWDKFKNPTQSLIFQCLHGVGHAILYSMDYDLDNALKACDLLADDYEQTSCYGGVVMENITAFEREKRDIDPSDPHYPCNKMDAKYQYSCYQMQTSIMTEVGVAIEDQGRECLNAGSGNIQACQVSIGRDISNYVRAGDVEYVARICQQQVGGQYVKNCVDGAVYALIDNTWDAKYAYKLCNALDTEHQAACYRDANWYLDTYDFDQNGKQQQCRSYAQENYELCMLNR